MPCENYREALTGAVAAAEGSAPALTRELRGHLDACATCHKFFSQEQQLFAAVDAGVRQTANAEVPASFLPRARTDVEMVTNGRSRWMAMLVFASAGVAIAITIFAVVRSGRNAPKDQVRQIASAPVREARPVTPDPSETPRAAAVPARRHRPGMNSGAQRSASFGQLEVLVPSEERDALARFIAARREESDFAVLPAAATPDRVDKPLSVSPLEIADLEVRPLDRLGGGAPDSRNENR